MFSYSSNYPPHRISKPLIQTLFLTLPIFWRGTLSQYAGRLHRIQDMKKEVVIYDYADLNISMLSTMYQRRLKGYKANGYEVEETFHSFCLKGLETKKSSANPATPPFSKK